jgi:hypothetical protein
MLQFKKVNNDAGADAGESDEGNGATPNEPDVEPDVVDELEDPFETEIPNNLEDNMETEEKFPIQFWRRLNRMSTLIKVQILGR